MSRIVKLATVSMTLQPAPSNMAYYHHMIELAKIQARELSTDDVDLIVFPEYFAYAQLSAEEKKQVAQSMPDEHSPLFETMASIARKYRSYVTYGAVEKYGELYFNVAVVLDRVGQYIGKYRKIHLAPGEEQFFTPGDQIVVLDTDFGKLGLAICMDIHYPEMWTIMALEGADVIAHPAAWMDYTGDLNESLVNARAIDNQNYVITSHFVSEPYLAGRHPGHSRIVDPFGRTRADTSHLPGVARATVDLDQGFEYWATGELKQKLPTLKECFLGMRKPNLYGKLVKEDTEQKWKIQNPVLKSR